SGTAARPAYQDAGRGGVEFVGVVVKSDGRRLLPAGEVHVLRRAERRDGAGGVRGGIGACRMKDNLLKFSTLLCDYRTRVIHTQFALDGRNKAQRRYKRGYISETELQAAVGVYDRA